MEEDKITIFVGMNRPAWSEFTDPGGYIPCPCGSILQCVQVTREHWQLGHFDTPIYVTFTKKELINIGYPLLPKQDQK